MVTQPRSQELLRETWAAYINADENAAEAGRALGKPPETVRSILKECREKGFHLSEGVRGTLEDAKISPHEAKGMWQHHYDPDTGRKLAAIRVSIADVPFESLKDEIREVISLATQEANPDLPPRFESRDGNLLVLDPSDVHIGKLSVATETGYEYNSEIAAHRLVEGSKALMRDAQAMGVTRVLFVIGNDISHIDNPRRQTTSGTPQDADASIFSIYRAASLGYRRVLGAALEMGLDVDILFCPSNHDWVLGFTIAQELAAWFHDHPNVTATEYNLSERHRKYFRFGSNLLMFTHGDGAKEADLPQIMLLEARQHIAECLHRYAYLHHFHHKIKKALGVRPMQREKDHIAMTVTCAGQGSQEGDNLQIEYVRSPSPPDGWHDRKGYLNRQAVEAFVHHAHDGRIRSLVEWF